MNSEIKWVSTTNMLIRDGEKILVIKRADDLLDFPGWYILPGGKQEFNETVEGAAIRETIEETGITPVGPVLRVVATHLHDYRSKIYVVNIFETTEFGGRLISSKEGEAQWVNSHELLNNPKLYPDLKRHIKLVLENPGIKTFFTYHKFDEKLSIIEEK